MSNAQGHPARGAVPLADLRRAPPRVQVRPASSVYAVAAEVRGPGGSVPPDWIAAARAELEPADLAALAPLDSPPLPDPVALFDVDAPPDLPSALQWLATVPEEKLLGEIPATRLRSPPWEAVARQPRRWLIAYARALGRVWKGIGPYWAAATGLIEREVERIETAVQREAVPDVMASIHDGASVSDGAWRLRDDELAMFSDHLGSGPLRVPEQGPTIIPLLTGPGTGCLVLPERGLLGSIMYPLPGLMNLADADLLAPAAALDALLGPQRATILRMLEQPVGAGRIAHMLQLTPGAVTHHIKALEASGLVMRERVSRHVIVSRTGRGSVLLALYDEP